MLIDNRHQHQGMGTELFRRLIDAAREEKLERVLGTILSENLEMIAICRKPNFQMDTDLQEGTVGAQLQL